MFNVPRQTPVFNMTVPVQPVPPHPPQPFPQFCVLRPDRTAVPLIALDELPSWLQVGNWDWSDPTLFQSMVPVSLSQVPRIGEYDVVCHHCCANLDIIQRSISQESSDKSSTRLVCTDDLRPPSTYPGASRAPTRGLFPTGPVPVSYQRYSLFGEPPFLSNLQNPYVGLCLVDTRLIERGLNTSPRSFYPQFQSYLLPTGSAKFVNPQNDQRPPLNPEAIVFDPAVFKSNKDSSTSSVSSGNCGGTLFSRKCVSTSISSFPSTGRKDVTKLPGAELRKRGASDHLSTSSTDVRSYSAKDLNVAVGQLKQVLGIGKDAVSVTPNPAEVAKDGMETKAERKVKKPRDEEPLSTDAHTDACVEIKLPGEETTRDAENGIQSKVETKHRGEKPSGGPGNGGKAPGRKRSRRRRQGKNPANGEGNRAREDSPSRQENSSTKRQWRREKIYRNKNEYGPGSRYWHMMMIPNWRVKVPQR